MRTVINDINRLTTLDKHQLVAESKKYGGILDLFCNYETGKLPVPNFAAGGIATPADAALMMQLGAETVFVGSGIFMSEDPESRAKVPLLEATTHFQDPDKVLDASTGLKSFNEIFICRNSRE